MASSQIRQFATLIDQLPCEADEYNLMENFENYNNCFESSTNNNKGKKTDSFSPLNSNLNDYIKNISKGQVNPNGSITNNRMKNSISSNGDDSSNIENNTNTQNKNSEEESLMRCNGNNLNKNESNSFIKNDPVAYFDKQNMLYENDVDVNAMKSYDERNALFIYDNDLTRDEQSNYIETLNSEMDNRGCEYDESSDISACKKNVIEIIHCNNECLTDTKFVSDRSGASHNGSTGGKSSGSGNNGAGNTDHWNKNGDASLYKFSTPFNDTACEENDENIVYRYSPNTMPSNNDSYGIKKKATNFTNGSLPNKDEEHDADHSFHNSKNLSLSGGERKKESLQDTAPLVEGKGENHEIKDERMHENTSINNTQKCDQNNSKRKGNKNAQVKNTIDENSTVIEYKDFCDMVKKCDEVNKNILFSKKAKVIKLDANKSLIIFPVNIHDYGDKYIAVNQKDLLEYISSSIEIDNEDLSSLKIKNYQKEKELQNMKAAYSMQTTNIHYLINRVIFKECEYENLKNKSLTLEQEINKLIQEINSLISQNKEGLYMQKAFIDYKCKCVLKLQELQPLLGEYYYDIFNYITSCRTLGQLSIWIPVFETRTESLETIANNLIKIMLNGLGAPFNSSPQYFLSNKKLLKKSISIESEEDSYINNIAKRKIIDNYLLNHFNSFNTTKENNSHFSNCHSLCVNSEESSSFLGTEELFLNSSKFPSMHSVVQKGGVNSNVNRNIVRNIVRNNSSSNNNGWRKKNRRENFLNKLNRSNTTPERFCVSKESYTNSDAHNIRNGRDFPATYMQEQAHKIDATLMSDERHPLKRKQGGSSYEEKEMKKIKSIGKECSIINDLSNDTLDGGKGERIEVGLMSKGEESSRLQKPFRESKSNKGHRTETNVYTETRDKLTEEPYTKDWCQKIHEHEYDLQNEGNEDDDMVDVYNSMVEGKSALTCWQRSQKGGSENEAFDDLMEIVRIDKIGDGTTLPNVGDERESAASSVVEVASDGREVPKGRPVCGAEPQMCINIDTDMEAEMEEEIDVEIEPEMEADLNAGADAFMNCQPVKRNSAQPSTHVKRKSGAELEILNKSEREYEFGNKKGNVEERGKDAKCAPKNQKRSSEAMKQKRLKDLDSTVEERGQDTKKKKVKSKGKVETCHS
ncbi:conserved Plasmodium protein, unknown function [Plasmodium knowlesi strain H]|uniref:Asparagine-rich protein n=3 Tax=Plasmodium knowlesi TaxID=5850 RepID=A0A5K1V482_PLAKH|nr:conserved Plasmodium protein, unknown function [Plasmodium knowlesi strain H]OTN65436.1 Uncharacterized protein PKNOH_S110097000 [Plasmodium knowlesi]CAA9989589.1 conserved Plasmodium protein, unknown function [Plasmodium knowlesi strain H]SBO22649.1 conserved Plasmodium protein, unknown function [Plasmodium knowlesi strain H]SBO23383.1 conserved Plasmodium protein, unknown function [Plasmodium knowlesi strain H]VVS79063.1 conserved Plasmodium protein, unknown function [Plasmodium knowlesi |eukprot:XP_002260314.1 hypothetical protein, conserved in Plasmodium species [Plasmodium knowlesi strain H]